MRSLGDAQWNPVDLRETGWWHRAGLLHRSRALGWPESGLGLRRVWVPAETPDTPVAKAKAALVIALGRRRRPRGQIKGAWDGVSSRTSSSTATASRVTLRRRSSADIADSIAGLAVQQLVWTAGRPSLGQPPGAVDDDRWCITALDGADISAPFTRPARAQRCTVLTDLWITRPNTRAAPPSFRQARPCKISGRPRSSGPTSSGSSATRPDTWSTRASSPPAPGAPDRGTFDISVTIPDAGEYVLKAFAVSMKDGAGEVANDSVSLTVR